MADEQNDDQDEPDAPEQADPAPLPERKPVDPTRIAPPPLAE